MASTPQDFTSGQVLTDTQMDKLPQGIIAVATPITATVGPTSGTTEMDVITAAAVTPAAAGRRWRIKFICRGVVATVVNDIFIIRIKEGATILQEFHVLTTGGGGTTQLGVCFEAIVDSPALSSHTYKATLTRATGTGTASISATATAPIRLDVEDAGLAV